MMADSFLIGAKEAFAIELLPWLNNSNVCVGVAFHYWVEGVVFGTDEIADITDLHLSFLRLAAGTVDMASLLIFSCEQNALAKCILGALKADMPSEGMKQALLRCSLWFHQILGGIQIISPVMGEQVRLFGVHDVSGAILFDTTLPRKEVDEVLIGVGQYLLDCLDAMHGAS